MNTVHEALINLVGVSTVDETFILLRGVMEIVKGLYADKYSDKYEDSSDLTTVKLLVENQVVDIALIVLHCERSFHILSYPVVSDHIRNCNDRGRIIANKLDLDFNYYTKRTLFTCTKRQHMDLISQTTETIRVGNCWLKRTPCEDQDYDTMKRDVANMELYLIELLK
jgi:hypothetical protein